MTGFCNWTWNIEARGQMRFRSVVPVDALPEGGALAVEIDGRQVVLFRSGGDIFALDNLCPHAGSRLEHGRLAGGQITCPLHGAKFDLTDGYCRNPKVGGARPIITHQVKVVEGQIEITLCELPTTAPQ